MLNIKSRKKLLIPILAMIIVVAMAGNAFALPNPQITSFPLVTRVLNQGAYNGYVLFAQRAVYDYGYYACTPDGLFGPTTEQCVEYYQSAHGLTSDGDVGYYTWREISYELYNVSGYNYLGSSNAYSSSNPYRYTIYNSNGWWVLHANGTYQGIN